LRSSPLPSRPSSLRLAATDDERDRLPEAIDHSRRALRVMRQNVGISLATKVLFVVLAPIGFVSLILAVAVDMGVSLLVTLNGLRLLGKRPPPAAAPAPTAGVDVRRLLLLTRWRAGPRSLRGGCGDCCGCEDDSSPARA
jgi:hypothetical protein